MKYINQLNYPDISYVTKTDVEDEAKREHGKPPRSDHPVAACVLQSWRRTACW